MMVVVVLWVGWWVVCVSGVMLVYLVVVVDV